MKVDEVLYERDALPQQQAMHREVVDGGLGRFRVFVYGEVHRDGVDAVVGEVGGGVGAKVGAVTVEAGAAGLVLSPGCEQHGYLAGQGIGQTSGFLDLLDGQRFQPAGDIAQVYQGGRAHVLFQRHFVNGGGAGYEMVGRVNVGADVGRQAKPLIGAGVSLVSLDGRGLHAGQPRYGAHSLAAEGQGQVNQSGHNAHYL